MKAKQNQSSLCARACSVRFVLASSRFHLSLYLHMQQSSGLSCVFVSSRRPARFWAFPPLPNDATAPFFVFPFVCTLPQQQREDPKKTATPMAGGARAFLSSSSSSSASPFPLLCYAFLLSGLSPSPPSIIKRRLGGPKYSPLSAERD